MRAPSIRAKAQGLIKSAALIFIARALLSSCYDTTRF